MAMTCPYAPRSSYPPKSNIVVDKDVAFALAYNKPVVALESTIISHGMPYPQNVQCAREVEEVIRKNGATPATIAILDGVIRVGLDNEALEKLGKLGPSVTKCSRRDIAHVIAEGGNGATTVSGTMLIAHKVGIRIFATGGIGGVHLNGETSMDISADLTELGRTPVTVVSAGVKSILDIGRTLEYLETQGVTVVGYKTKEFPAFFVPQSGFEASSHLESSLSCAKLIKSNAELQLNSGILVACPIPNEHAAEAAKVEGAIKTSLQEADVAGVKGKEVTPFLLKRINEITGGESLRANIALVKNNASIAAQIAVELSQLGPITPLTSSSSVGPSSTIRCPYRNPDGSFSTPPAGDSKCPVSGQSALSSSAERCPVTGKTGKCPVASQSTCHGASTSSAERCPVTGKTGKCPVANQSTSSAERCPVTGKTGKCPCRNADGSYNCPACRINADGSISFPASTHAKHKTDKSKHSKKKHHAKSRL